MQDCSNGCQVCLNRFPNNIIIYFSSLFNLILHDQARWECMFISSTDIPDGDEVKVDRTSIQDIDLPVSWVNPLNITSQSIILKSS